MRKAIAYHHAVHGRVHFSLRTRETKVYQSIALVMRAIADNLDKFSGPVPNRRLYYCRILDRDLHYMPFRKPLALPVEHVGSQKHWSAFLFSRGFQPH
jgi:hypothetical protein